MKAGPESPVTAQAAGTCTKIHETILEVNLSALIHNLRFYKSRLKPNTRVMAMIKAFGYGSGSYEVAKALADAGIDYLGVAFADEGIELRKAGITTPIMVMTSLVSAFDAMIDYRLEPEIYSAAALKAFIAAAEEKGHSGYPVHIKLDTGMHRLGFQENDLEELINLLRNATSIKVESIFSHLSSGDMPEYSDFTKGQIDKFEEWSQSIMKALSIQPFRHMLNTSGVYHYPEAQYEMVRLGVGLYGAGNDETEDASLQTVGTLKTIIIQIKDIAPGESIGYSRRFRTTSNTKIAILPIGYADGIPRAWGNEKGYVMINNQKAVIIGTISMDMMMVDVTAIDCNEGDEAIIFGSSPTVKDIAKTTGTISYEILTSISQRVKRIFYYNQE
jgi:alanine racemase